MTDGALIKDIFSVGYIDDDMTPLRYRPLLDRLYIDLGPPYSAYLRIDAEFSWHLKFAVSNTLESAADLEMEYSFCYSSLSLLLADYTPTWTLTDVSIFSDESSEGINSVRRAVFHISTPTTVMDLAFDPEDIEGFRLRSPQEINEWRDATAAITYSRLPLSTLMNLAAREHDAE